MTSPEYIQLRAFARIDGAMMSLLWIASFALFARGIGNSLAVCGGMLLGLYSLVFAVRRLLRFRDGVRQGSISFARSYGYIVLMFFYASILFAIAQAAYFSWLDGGRLVADISAIVHSADNARALAASGLAAAMDESLGLMAKTTPIEYALNYLTTNIMLGAIVGLPIAAFCRKATATAAPQSAE